MCHAVLVDLKKKGLGKVDYKPPITKEDLTKLYSGSTIYDLPSRTPASNDSNS
jgi:hypothetical protein